MGLTVLELEIANPAQPRHNGEARVPYRLGCHLLGGGDADSGEAGHKAAH